VSGFDARYVLKTRVQSFVSIDNSAARLAGPGNSLRRASCLEATSFFARASIALPLSLGIKMRERRSLAERARAQRSRLSRPSSIATKFGRRMPSVLAISADCVPDSSQATAAPKAPPASAAAVRDATHPQICHCTSGNGRVALRHPCEVVLTIAGAKKR
jgi:hypothetical protein